MARKKASEETDETKEEGLVTQQDFTTNTDAAIDAFCRRWRMALSPTERDVEDFDIMRLRHELGLYRTPEGMDLFPRARRILQERGYVFRSAFGSEIMFLVRRGTEIEMDFDEAELV